MLQVSKGVSDLPGFGLLHDGGGVALAIYKGDAPEPWRQEQSLDARQRVEHLAHANYAADSELMRSLTLAIESGCKRIALAALNIGA